MMSRPLRILTLLIGILWAQALMVSALSLLFTPAPAGDRLVLGIGLFAAGAFVAMCLVIDPLVPGAGPVVVVPLKLAAGLVFWACVALSVYGIAFGQPWA